MEKQDRRFVLFKLNIMSFLIHYTENQSLEHIKNGADGLNF